MRGGEKGKNNSVNFKKSKNKKFEILIIGLFNYFDGRIRNLVI